MTVMLSCGAMAQSEKSARKSPAADFKYQTEQFADTRILRYQVPGFEQLSLNQKLLVYYLSQATLAGRDIIYDQNYRYNLLVRKTLEAIREGYKGDRSTPEFEAFSVYLKRVWFCNGIHHHYSTDKFFPEFTKDYFAALVKGTKTSLLPLAKGQKLEAFIAEITPVIFDQEVAPKRVSLDPAGDLVALSACNFYEGVSREEAEKFYASLKEKAKLEGRDTLISFGLNSRLVKSDGMVTEQVYKSGGLYGPAIDRIIQWLNKALPFAENPAQAESIRKLISFYQTGSLVTWDEYNIAWVRDLESKVDFINGFIEVYGDPMAMKGSWEAMVNFKDVEATRRTEVLSSNAQYFEDNSPVDQEYKKEKVKGVSAKVITAAQLGGDCHPSTPIGINLPNANWIRKIHGSKSVTIDNITYSYDQAAKGNGFIEEFAFSDEEKKRVKVYGYLAGCLTTDLHECLGHGSGQLKPGVTGDALQNYHSTIEETRADLFALYYIADPMMQKLGLVPDEQVAMAEYDNFIRNGLMTQLVRIQPGKTIEESHMRDRALIAQWAYEKGQPKKVIEKVSKDGKTYFRINDYKELRNLFGELLGIIQRITSEGNYEEAGKLVHEYAVKVDPVLHREVLDRYAKLNIAPYAGFINPEYTLVRDGDRVIDVTVSYPVDFSEQMMRYSKEHSYLPAR